MEYKVGNIRLLLNSAEYQRINTSWLLLYVRGGVGMYSQQGRMCGLDEGEVIFFPPGSALAFDAHSLGDEYNASLDAVAVRFDVHWLDAFLRLFPCNSEVVMTLKENKVPTRIVGTKWLKITDLMDRLRSSEPRRQALLLLEIIDLLAEPTDLVPLAPAVSSVSAADVSGRKEKIDRYLSCNLMRKFTLDEIAGYAGMNRTYFCLFFKKHYGASLTDHVNRLRIDMACSMLKQGDMTIADIARACGFPTVTYFNRVFRNIKGISPREFR